MLRTLALVLLLANALLLAALTGLFDPPGSAAPDREPERLQRQHQPGLVRVLSPQAASAALAAADTATAQAAAAASSALALACLEAGPFSATDASAAERTLREAGLAVGAWQVQRSDDSGAFMVYMGRYADRETVQRKLAELKRLKLDAEDLRAAPELQPGISLGRFDSQAQADAAMAQMAQQGLRTARVITLRQAQSQTLLRVPAADAALRARLAGLQLPSGPGFLPCAAAASGAAPGAAPAASAASAAALPAAPAAPQAASRAAPPAAPQAAPPAAAKSAAPPAAAVASRPAAAVASRPAAPVAPKPVPAPAASMPAASAPAPRLSAAAGSVAGASTRAALARAASAAAADAAALSASR